MFIFDPNTAKTTQYFLECINEIILFTLAFFEVLSLIGNDSDSLWWPNVCSLQCFCDGSVPRQHIQHCYEFVEVCCEEWVSMCKFWVSLQCQTCSEFILILCFVYFMPFLMITASQLSKHVVFKFQGEYRTKCDIFKSQYPQ